MYIFFYPCICWWIFQLLPCLGSCELYCCEYRSAYTFSNYIFVWLYAQRWDCWSYGKSIFRFFGRTSLLVSSCGRTSSHSHQQWQSIPFSPHPLQPFFIDLNDGSSDQCEVAPHCSFRNIWDFQYRLLSLIQFCWIWISEVGTQQ